MKYVSVLFDLAKRIFRRARMHIVKRLFASVGRNVVFFADDIFTYKNIFIGNDVYIGPGANFSASESSITIEDKVMFGPGVTIMGGDHNTSVIGKYMFDIKDKKVGDDLPVVISTDCWIGCNVSILKGVTIGRGSIVAAGAVVTKSMPEYSVVGGVPARVLKPRFSEVDLELHKRKLS